MAAALDVPRASGGITGGPWSDATGEDSAVGRAAAESRGLGAGESAPAQPARTSTAAAAAYLSQRTLLGDGTRTDFPPKVE